MLKFWGRSLSIILSHYEVLALTGALYAQRKEQISEGKGIGFASARYDSSLEMSVERSIDS